MDKTPATNIPYNLGNVMEPISKLPLQARAPRVEFPTFEGEGFKDWVYKAEQYFLIDMTPDVWKVRLASMYLEGKALTWYHHYTQNHSCAQNINWEELKTAMHSRFGERGSEDPMAELRELNQKGDLQPYLEEFEHLTTQVHLSES